MNKKRQASGRGIVAAHSGANYPLLVADISGLLEQARRVTVRTINSFLTATYWEVGRRIVEFEQGGAAKAEYGEKLIARLADDLTARHGRGFSERNLRQMRLFYQGWEIRQTPSAKFEARAKIQLPSGEADVARPVPTALPTGAFPLSWSHYVRLISVETPVARAFYEAESVRGGWSVRQLDRQIGTQFYERTAHAKQPDVFLERGRQTQAEDEVSMEEQIRDPYLLEFLNLKDEYIETELEDAIVRHLEWFLLELGTGFAFVARQKRIRIGDEWYRMDLLLYHRRLKCLVVVDLKIGKFTHADAGQMNLYLNYARENLMEPGENPPIGVILCSAKNDAVVHYAMGGIKANVFASRYMTALPDEETLRREILTTQRALNASRVRKEKGP